VLDLTRSDGVETMGKCRKLILLILTIVPLASVSFAAQAGMIDRPVAGGDGDTGDGGSSPSYL